MVAAALPAVKRGGRPTKLKPAESTGTAELVPPKKKRRRSRNVQPVV